MKEFSRIKIPTLAVFGSCDDGITKTAEDHLNYLEKRTSSEKFGQIIIKDADHGFTGYEKQLANKIVSWLKRLKNANRI